MIRGYFGRRVEFAVVLGIIVGLLGNSAHAAGPVTVQYLQTADAKVTLTSLDIYAPEGAENWPVLIYIHGGGWCIGDKAHVNNLRDFAQELGFVLVSVNYRLAPAVAHPTYIEDVAAAVAWVHRNIGDYGGDASRMYVMGHSAGAHLAALIATDERRLEAYGLPLSTFAGVILLDGAGYDLTLRMETFVGERAVSRMYYKAWGTDGAVWQDASPVTHVEAGKGIAPFLILTAGGRADAVVQAQRLGSALEAAGVAARVVDIPGETHSTINRELGLAGEGATQEVQAFLHKPVK